MISAANERRFRVLELACYVAVLLGIAYLKCMRLFFGKGYSDYTMPGLFTGLGFFGLVFMFRFFIYAKPENILDRTLIERSNLTKEKKVLLIIGHIACVFMLLLGVIGLFSPRKMEGVITLLSPLTWFRLN